MPETKSSACVEHPSQVFKLPLSSYVLCFWDLPTSLGFEWALSPVVLSFKFTFNTFSAPLDLWELLWLLKFAAECCKYSRQVIVLQVHAGRLAKE